MDCKKAAIRQGGFAGNSFLNRERLVAGIRRSRLALRRGNREHRPGVLHIQGSDDVVSWRQNGVSPVYFFGKVKDRLSACQIGKRDCRKKQEYGAAND